MTIFNKTNLSRSQHTIVLTEASDDEAHPWVDLDYVVLEDDDPSLASSVSTLFIDNTDAALQFFPAPWDVVSDSSSFQGSFSRTQLASARVELEFTGSTISVYGRVAPENGLYLCNIDGGANQSFTGYSPQAASQQTLFFANNLKGGSTRHVLQVYNEPQGGENGTSGIEIDFVRIWGNEMYVLGSLPRLTHYSLSNPYDLAQ
ncbi:hypothetical protein DL93DRAFT_2078573 [Clavulina sp. PMI_390]|nr:hypothetical protein DL93DRAFT_2078573 [Clavulina sp. PMI_390]